MKTQNCPNLSVFRHEIFSYLIKDMDSQVNISHNGGGSIEISRLNCYNNWKNESIITDGFSYEDVIAEFCRLSDLKRSDSLAQMKELSIDEELIGDCSGTLLMVIFNDAKNNSRISLYVKERNNNDLKMIDKCIDELNKIKYNKESKKNIVESIFKILEKTTGKVINE